MIEFIAIFITVFALYHWNFTGWKITGFVSAWARPNGCLYIKVTTPDESIRAFMLIGGEWWEYENGGYNKQCRATAQKQLNEVAHKILNGEMVIRKDI